MHQELYLPFLRLQLGWIILFAVVVFLGFPCEGVILPVQYAKLATQPEKSRTLYIIFGLWVIVTGLYVVRESIHLKVLPSYITYLRQRMFKFVVDDFSMGSTKSSYIDTARTISRINKVSEVTGELGEWVMRDLFPLSIALLVINGFLYTKSSWVGGTMTVGLGLMVGATVILGNRVVQKSMKKEKAFLDASNHMNDKFDNIENIVFSVNEDEEEEKMKKENLKYENNSRNSLIDARNLKAITIGLSVVTFVAVLLIALKKLRATPGVLLTITLVMVYFLNWTLALFHSIPQSMSWLATILVNNDYISEMFGVSEKGTRKADFTKDIVFQNVTYAYDTNPTLQNVSFTIPARKKTVIYGTSGSGKTTILKLILKKLAPQEGNILIGDIPLQNIHTKTMRQQIGFSNQNTILFETTIRENIRYGNGSSDTDIDAFVEKYSLQQLFQNGLDAEAGKNGLKSSKGMQKIVSIARVLLHPSTPIMIFDEPLAGVDSNTQKQVMRMLKEHTEGKTVIIISHHTETKDLADQIIEMDAL